ncbi:MAG TPA: hypothetical protein VGK36_19000 [Candidatus Angelobacter sp.]|jgi:hypothetical protein
MTKGLNTFLAAVLALGSTGLAFATSVDRLKQALMRVLNSGFPAKSGMNSI